MSGKRYAGKGVAVRSKEAPFDMGRQIDPARTVGKVFPAPRYSQAKGKMLRAGLFAKRGRK